MELLHRHKAFFSISRYRLCRRSSFSSLASGKASAEAVILGDSPSPPFSTPLHSGQNRLLAMQNPSRRCVGIQRTLDTYPKMQQLTPFCCNLRRFSDWGCRSTNTGSFHVLVQKFTSTAYAPPSPQKKSRGVDHETEAGGATFNLDDPQGMAAMEGADDVNMPPFDDADYPEDDEEYEAEEPPPPDPEEKLLYSPSDED